MKSFTRFVLSAVCVLALSALGLAQAISGDLVGTVKDSTGAVVPNVSVVATNVATGVKSTTVANGNGEYRLSNLPIGNYNLSASSNGLTGSANSVLVELNRTATANLTLQVSGATTTVEVTAAAATIDTTTPQIQSSFEAVQTQDLPTASASGGVLNLSLLDAGVASSGGIGAGSGPSIGGQRPRNNNFTIDGVDNNSKSVTGPLVNVPNDAVANFTLLQNQFSPEFGHSSGGQFNTVVRSGTNTLHGVAYEYFQNRNLNAIDDAIARSTPAGTKPMNPRFDNNRFGGEVGGPIIKDKLFFFGNYEYNPVGAAAVPGSPAFAPTAAGYSALGALPGISATNLGILQKFVPAAAVQNTDSTLGPTTVTVAGAAIPVGIDTIVGPNFTNNRAAVGSIDYNISQKDSLRGRYIYNSSVGIDTSAEFPAFYQPFPNKFHLVTISEYHTFTPNLTNEFRVGFNHFAQTLPAGNFQFPGLDQFPNLEFFDLGIQVGPDPNAPQSTVQGLYQANENLSWVKGNHNLKFGVEGRKYISPQFFVQRSRGDYDYNTVDLYLRDITPDNLGERSTGNPTYYGDQSSIYWYANDSWRVRPNFTVDLGLRYEFTSVPTGERLQSLNSIASVPGLINFGVPQPQYKNYAPRVGFAYSPGASGNTSIRGGFGIAYDVLYDNIGILSLPPEFGSTVDVNLGVGNNFLANGGIPNAGGGITTFPDAATARSNTSTFVPDQKLPYSESWNLGIQHVFAQKYTVEARYVGTRGVHLNVQTRLNRQPKINPDDPSSGLPTFFQAPTQAQLDALPLTLGQINARSSFVPAYAAAGFTGSNVVAFEPFGSSNYNGLALQANRNFQNGLQFQLAYTWSHTLDNSTADFFSTVLTPRRPQDFQNFAADYGTSALDRRHRFTAEILYDVPFFKNRGYFMKNLLGNWEFAPIYTYESPEFADVQSGRDANLNGDSAGDRAIFNPAGVPGTGSDVTALCDSAYFTSVAAANGVACGSSGPDKITGTGKKTVSASSFVVGYLANNPNAQYIRGGLGVVVNGLRNTLPTRPINNVDLTAAKRFNFTERMRMEFQAQLYNLFNHPQFVPGSINNINSIGDTSAATVNLLTPGSAVFNHPDQVFNSNARTMQLALKFIF